MGALNKPNTIDKMYGTNTLICYLFFLQRAFTDLMYTTLIYLNRSHKDHACRTENCNLFIQHVDKITHTT